MGLSSSSSKTTTNTNQQSNQSENATTTPVAPDWLTQAAQDYVGRIGAFGDMDPNGFVAPSSPLQNMAWQNANSLGDWRQQTATASQMAQGAGNASPNYAGLSPVAADALGGDKIMTMRSGPIPAPQNAFSGASSQQGPAYTYQAPQVAAPPNPTAYAAQPAHLGTPGLVSGAGYSAPQLGQAQGYAAARIGTPIGAQASEAAPASLLSNLSAYQSPYQHQVVDTALANYDQTAGRALAANQAAAARNGALGGSRYAIEDALMRDDQAKSRAQLEAQLEDQGFNTAAGLANADAGYRQAASLFNAQNRTANNQFNAGQDWQGRIAQAGLDTDALKYGADMGNQFTTQQAALNAAAGQYNAGNEQQARLANQNIGGQYDLARFGADTSAAQNYAAALNAAGLTGYQGQLTSNQLGAQLGAQAGQYNAGANNQMSQFNASQSDAALNRSLAAAGLLGNLANDYGAGTRADLATMGQLGDQQRGVEQAYAMAGPAQLQLMGQLSGMTPYDILVGRNVSGTTNGTMTGSGVNTASQSPSLFSQLLQAGQAVAPFI